MYIALLTLAGILLLVCGMLAWQVDDWSRDFVQNRAATDVNAANAALRPIQANVDPADMTHIIEEAVSQLNGWRIESQIVSETRVEIILTRTSRMLRFVDDVTVMIEPTADGCSVNATSQSRVGKGDLGQNPRNLAELLTAIRERLAK